MRRLPLLIGLVVLVCAAGGGLAASQSALAGGNSDAAHACQGDGYQSLARSDGTSFENVGECVSYAAHGGQFSTPLPSCTVTATTGCLTFDSQTLTDDSGDTLTLSGSFSFDSTCSTGECLYSAPESSNDLALGGGTYTETDSSGATIASGTFTAADTSGEGLYATAFANDSGTSTCQDATSRSVAIIVGDSESADLGAVFAFTTAPSSGVEVTEVVLNNGADTFFGSVDGTTITC